MWAGGTRATGHRTVPEVTGSLLIPPPPPVYRPQPIVETPPPPPPPPAPRVEAFTVTKQITGVAVGQGQGCNSNAPVTLTVDGNPVANTVANSQGGFQTTFPTGTIPAGQHAVVALCGATLNAVLDIVLVSEIGTPAATVAMILLFLLMIGWLQRSRVESAADSSAAESLVNS